MAAARPRVARAQVEATIEGAAGGARQGPAVPPPPAVGGSRKAKKAGSQGQAKLMQDITGATDEALVRLRSRIARATMHWL